MEQLAAGLIGALFAVIVGAAAALITARLEHRRWLRQERLEAWTTLVDTATKLALHGARFGHVDVATHPELKVSVGADLSAVLLTVGAVQARAYLLGPRKIADAADELMSMTGRAAGLVTDESDLTMAEHAEALQKLLDEFIVLARGVLRAD